MFSDKEINCACIKFDWNLIIPDCLSFSNLILIFYVTSMIVSNIRVILFV